MCQTSRQRNRQIANENGVVGGGGKSGENEILQKSDWQNTNDMKKKQGNIIMSAWEITSPHFLVKIIYINKQSQSLRGYSRSRK